MNNLTITGVNESKCTQCMACVKECPARLFADSEDRVCFHDPHNDCIHCSHCIAVCPVDAVSFESGEVPYNFGGADHPEKVIPFDVFRRFVTSRRSVRQFKQTPVEEEKINALLDLLRYAPSSSNLQQWEYLLVTDKGKRESLIRYTLKGMKLVERLLRIRWLVLPFLKGREKRIFKSPRTRESIREVFDCHRKGDDRILFHAPAVLILHSPSYGHLAGNDAGIALTHTMLAAHSLGLGSCWIGFVQEAFFLYGKMRKEMGIPKDHSVWGVLALGYPDVKYYRGPIRKPLKVRRM
ncbi:MAG: nitroreductase family protein [Spirochaetales bacterium]|nr:nitroreductase family protein [Spirochaetales bacterium]